MKFNRVNYNIPTSLVVGRQLEEGNCRIFFFIFFLFLGFCALSFVSIKIQSLFTKTNVKNMKILGRAAVFMNYNCRFAAETIQCLNAKYQAIYSNNFRKHTHMERYANYQGFWSMFFFRSFKLRENWHASPTLSDMNLIRLNWVSSWDVIHRPWSFVLEKTVPSVSGRTRNRGHSFSQYRPTKVGEYHFIYF